MIPIENLETLEKNRYERNINNMYERFPFLKDCQPEEIIEYLWLSHCELEGIIQTYVNYVQYRK